MTEEFIQLRQLDNLLIVSSQHKWDDMVSINVLQKNLTNTSSIKEYYIGDDSIDETAFELKEDGYYTVFRIVIPKQEWVNTIMETDMSRLLRYESIYVVDNNKIYKLGEDDYSYTEVTDIEEVLLDAINNKTNTRVLTREWFSYYYLEQCLIRFIKMALKKYTSCHDVTFSNGKCGCGYQEYNITNLDFRKNNILMYMNLIKYYARCKNFFEAQRLLEEFIDCFGYCKDNATKVGHG